MRKIRLQGLLVFAGLATLAIATATAAPLPIKDFVKHPELTNPVISPDGKYLAIVLDLSKDDSSPESQLAVLHLLI